MNSKDAQIIFGLTALLIVLVVAGSFLKQTEETTQEADLLVFSQTEDMMDTYITVTLYAEDQETADTGFQEAFDQFSYVNSIASRFDPNSELYMLNSQGTLQSPSPDLVSMIQTSIAYNVITQGAFDITILPLLNLWSNPLSLFSIPLSYAEDLNNSILPQSLRDEFDTFEPTLYALNESPTISWSDQYQSWTVSSSWQKYYLLLLEDSISVTANFWYLPYESQSVYINETKLLVGSDKITIDDDSITLFKGSLLTLDGIAKGYAADLALAKLTDLGFEHALIDAGGDIATNGAKPDGSPWTAALVNPENTSEFLATFELSGQSIATSGNYIRYFDENASAGHILDPISGRTSEASSSCTIIASNCTVADILATGVFVLGPEVGIDVVEGLLEIEAMVLAFDNPQDMSFSEGISQFYGL